MFSKVRARLGGNIEYLVSGSAALSKDIGSWFAAVGLELLEGYGLTETSAGSMVGRPGKNRVGTVGMPFPGTEVKIADDGEILVRGGGVMRGYHNLPDATAEMLIGDGWLATGDIGEIDDDGLVRITDRKKDLIKTSGGKYIAPSLIEAQFKALCPLLANVIVHANGRNYATALVTLDPDVTAGFAEAEGIAAARRSGRPTRRSRRRCATRSSSSTPGSTAGRRSRTCGSCRATSPSTRASSPRA